VPGCPFLNDSLNLPTKSNLPPALRLFSSGARILLMSSLDRGAAGIPKWRGFAGLCLATHHRFTPDLSGPLGTSAVCFSTFMTDDAKSLARALKQRDPEILDRLIEQYQFRLFRYLVHLTASRERAEDFFQETWLRVLERGHQYDGKWKFEAWLFAIARNLVLDWHRRKKPQSIDSLAGPGEDATFDVQDERGQSPLEQVLQAEQKSGVQQSLEKVPAIYREVLVLRFQEELQLDEIAGVIGAPISTVKSRLYRGLEAVKSAMVARAIGGQGGAA